MNSPTQTDDPVLFQDTEPSSITGDHGPMPEIPGYQVCGLLGQGGMGAVYLAYETDTGRDVAIKVLQLTSLKTANLKARFRLEATIGHALQHPEIISVHASGETDEFAWIAMEYLDGFELTTAIHDPSFELTDRLQVIMRVARALQYAHEQNVLHRDVKPSNIFMTRDGEVRLLDFGIARIPTDIRLTQTGFVMGTPRYMSPEQLTGDELDARADIFSLGVVLYECLTGQVPWEADNPARLMIEVCTKAPKPLTEAFQESPLTLTGVDHHRLARIVERAIRPDITRRYPSMTAFADDLQELLDGSAPESVSAPAPRSPETIETERQIQWALARAARLQVDRIRVPRAVSHRSRRPILSTLEEHRALGGRQERVWRLLTVMFAVGLLLVLCFALMR